MVTESALSTQTPSRTDTPIGLPPTSLIICSRNRARLLRETIDSILQGQNVPNEIVIIDQSDQANAELAALHPMRRCEIRYQCIKPRGVSRARNLGMSIARNDWLVFTDDDVLAAPDWFGALMQACNAAGPHTVVTGQVLTTSDDRGDFAPSLKTDEAPAIYVGRVGQDVLFSGNMALHKSVIAQVGGFDERLGPGTRFPAAEDNDLGFRLLEAGYRIEYVPQAVIYHRAWRTAQEYVAVRRSYGLGRGAFYAKHLHLRDRYILRRMVHDVWNHLQQSVWRFHDDRLRAEGDVVLAGSILYGAARWLLTQRRK